MGAGGGSAANGTDTWFNGASCTAASTCAKAGNTGAFPTGGTGGASGSGVGTVLYSGGAGGNGQAVKATNGGGGGGAAGLNAAGNAGAASPTSTGGQGDGTFGGTGGAVGSGVGGNGTEWDATDGSGGGGGGASANGTAGGAGGTYGAGGGGGRSTAGVGGAGMQGVIVVTYTPATPTSTTLADGTNPSNASLVPGGAATMADAFTFTTNSGTDSISAVTVSFAAGTATGIGLVEITNDAGTTVYGSVTNPTDTQSITLSTALPVTTTATQFKIRITPKSASVMPVPPGASYAVTAIISAWTGTNAKVGTDTASATVTIDNLSPNGATVVSGTAGTNANTINWTTSNSADFNTTSGSVILRWAAASAGTEVPAEGSTYAAGNTIGTATVACVISSSASTALSKVDGTSGSAGCTTVALTNGQAYTYKVFQKDTSGNYDVGVSIGTFTPAVSITVTSYTNTTETALNYAAACMSCGARIGGGAGFRQSITITGSGFGALTCGTGNCSTATNNIKIGTHQIADANITSWAATSITFLTDSSVTGDTDTDWGTNFGGASAIVVTAASSAATGLNFYVFPQITGVRSCDKLGFPVGTYGREYNAGDALCPNGLTDGEVFLDGTRFGTASTGGYVQILGIGATTVSWSNTLIQAQVPPAIADNAYTGGLVMQQGSGSNNKTYTYTTTGFRVLPRITSPASASIGDPITISGDHLCQSGTCPTAFGTTDNIVVFTSYATSTVFTSWSDTTIATVVPASTVNGNIVVTSNTFTSNGANFTLLSPTPVSPSNLLQKNAGLTTVLVGGTASSTPLSFFFDTSSGVTGGTMYPQVEVRPVLGTDAGFLSTCTANPYCKEGTGVAYSGGTINLSVSTTTADNTYHWQVRARYNKNSTDYYSPWVSFGGNAETATDILLDTTPPVMSTPAVSNLSTNSVTISWDTLGEVSTSQVQYNQTNVFALSCSTNNDCSTLDSTLVNTHTVNLANLNSGTTYYYRARSKDAVGNESLSTTSTFSTLAVSGPAKTVVLQIGSVASALSTPSSYYFTVPVPEVSPSVKSVFVEIIGLVSGGTNPINIGVNGLATTTYAVSATNPTHFKLIYKIADESSTSPLPETTLNVNDVTPCTNGSGGATQCNRLSISPGAGMSIAITSARLIMSYSYTP